MTIVDAGPLIALTDSSDQEHLRCRAAISSLPVPLVSTWPAITEAMYILGDRAGWPGQRALWSALGVGGVEVSAIMDEDLPRMKSLMEKYRDLSMDLADASLVAVADRLGIKRVFTVDSDFAVYRTAKGKRFELIP